MQRLFQGDGITGFLRAATKLGSGRTLRAGFTKKKPDQAQKAQAAFVPLSLS